ncbi:hypothetical protein [Mucilaginibacter ginkgonis]|uniref:Stationary phase survival protein SurE n=1 Tax=Mucilaginibacter ginkgonis TaxID=2682091 RepID=A0A6I4I098_9SPHI|nr:hypothetical protein [Mucilaginibacter ginkgonis]QQL48335.1 hypothetical protein GO620_009015 [Mucilaginibacter ginkgonis]
MFKFNNFYLGLLVGAIFPVLSWLTFHVWYSTLVFMNKPVIPYFTAILINLVLIRTYHKNGAEKTTRGVMLVSFIFLLMILFINRV